MNESQKGCAVEPIGYLRTLLNDLNAVIYLVDRHQLDVRTGLNAIRETGEEGLPCVPSEYPKNIGLEGELQSLVHRLRFIEESLAQDVKKLKDIVL